MASALSRLAVQNLFMHFNAVEHVPDPRLQAGAAALAARKRPDPISDTRPRKDEPIVRLGFQPYQPPATLPTPAKV